MIRLEKIFKTAGLFFIIVFSFLIVNTSLRAETVLAEENIKDSIYLDKATIEKGYTVSSFDNKFKLSLVPGVFNETTEVDSEIIKEDMPMPWKLDKVSSVYQFDFKNKESYNNHKPFYIEIFYEEDSLDYKQVFFYDKNFNKWRPLPSTDYPNKKFIRSLIHLPYARIAVFSNPDILITGQASWYAYKDGNYVASPDFPKGSRLRVFNLENDKFVDVEVNDYGPDRSIFPERVVDLDKEAFAKIANLGEGIINVKVEPIFIPEEEVYRITGVRDVGAEINPTIKAQAAIILDNDNNEVLWEKNPDEVLSLASLSKLVALKVFLDQGVSLEKEVFYNKQDEIFNNKYCEPWESAKINLQEGDIITIENLIYASLVGSANNAVESLVRLSGLTRDEFIKEMNQYAQFLGAKTTYFEEPTGLSPQNVSSVKDYAIISKEIFKEKIIREVSSQAGYEFTTVNTKRNFHLRNTNSLVKSGFIPGFSIVASKTGYLHEAGYCLIVRAHSAEKGDIVVLVMKENKRSDSFNEIKDLVEYGFKIID
ncbi:serine hydrolase [bacterium]|nr:serine hydrolase [bacterium]